MLANLLNIALKNGHLQIGICGTLELYSKAKAGDSTNTYNQTYNSRAAVFDSFL